MEKYFVSVGVVGNALLFWRAGNAGYTCDMSKAKLFRLEEAKQVASQKEGARIISQKNALEACIVSVDCQYAKFEE